MWRWRPFLGLLLRHAPTASPRRLGFPLGLSRRLPLVAWHLPLSWSWSAEDKVVLGSISWRSGLFLFILWHFFFLGMGHGLDMKWAGVANSFGPTPNIIVIFPINYQTNKFLYIFYLYIKYFGLKNWLIFPRINN